jgi:phosphatidylserine decarboxylase
MDEFTWSDPPSRFAFPIAAAGVPLIFGAAFATLILALLGLTVPTLIGLAATFGICAFFRDPDRVVPAVPNVVVSPADGKVIAATLTDGGPYFEGECRKVSIFMSVLNVHVNRAPVEGRVTRVRYRPGQFVPADRRDASGRNEHNAVYLQTDDGRSLCVVQVAGLIARRIICRVQAGDRLLRGQRFGMICFGSRLDLYLPPEIRLQAAVGDRVSAGSSILGSFESPPSVGT